jgi:hypothetical protein
LARRAVSQIIGTLIMLGVVSVAGGVLFINGIQVLTEFDANINSQSFAAAEKIQEKIVISHIRFHSNDEVTLYVRNVGQVESEVISIKVLNRDEQTLDCCDENEFTGTTLLIQEPTQIDLELDTNYINTDDYKISIITARDNTFTKFVRPLNG